MAEAHEVQKQIMEVATEGLDQKVFHAASWLVPSVKAKAVKITAVYYLQTSPQT